MPTGKPPFDERPTLSLDLLNSRRLMPFHTRAQPAKGVHIPKPSGNITSHGEGMVGADNLNQPVLDAQPMRRHLVQVFRPVLLRLYNDRVLGVPIEDVMQAGRRQVIGEGLRPLGRARRSPRSGACHLGDGSLPDLQALA